MFQLYCYTLSLIVLLLKLYSFPVFNIFRRISDLNGTEQAFPPLGGMKSIKRLWVAYFISGTGLLHFTSILQLSCSYLTWQRIKELQYCWTITRVSRWYEKPDNLVSETFSHPFLIKWILQVQIFFICVCFSLLIVKL